MASTAVVSMRASFSSVKAIREGPTSKQISHPWRSDWSKLDSCYNACGYRDPFSPEFHGHGSTDWTKTWSTWSWGVYDTSIVVVQRGLRQDSRLETEHSGPLRNHCVLASTALSLTSEMISLESLSAPKITGQVSPVLLRRVGSKKRWTVWRRRGHWLLFIHQTKSKGTRAWEHVNQVELQKRRHPTTDVYTTKSKCQPSLDLDVEPHSRRMWCDLILSLKSLYELVPSSDLLVEPAESIVSTCPICRTSTRIKCPHSERNLHPRQAL
jgi:hypothetical protein